jgi:hypothetical protein
VERQVPGIGNGGWAGTISYGALASALQEGYTTGLVPMAVA